MGGIFGEGIDLKEDRQSDQGNHRRNRYSANLPGT